MIGGEAETEASEEGERLAEKEVAGKSSEERVVNDGIGEVTGVVVAKN